MEKAKKQGSALVESGFDGLRVKKGRITIRSDTRQVHPPATMMARGHRDKAPGVNSDCRIFRFTG